MNVISRIIGALVSVALSWIGARLGIEFTEADHQTVTIAAAGLVTLVYGVLHPIIRSRLVAWTGKGTRVADDVKPPQAGAP